MTRDKVFVFLTSALCALPSLGQNLLLNPDFNADTAPWELTEGLSMAHTGRDGFLASGAAEILDDSQQAGFFPAAAIRQCVDLGTTPATRPLMISAAIKPENYSSIFSRMDVSFWDDNECSLNMLDSASTLESDLPVNAWSSLEQKIGGKPKTAASALVSVTAFSPPGVFRSPGDEERRFTLVTRIDDVFFGSDSLIFEDGFESGNASAWSLEVSSPAGG